jgi:hypothetical protein
MDPDSADKQWSTWLSERKEYEFSCFKDLGVLLGGLVLHLVLENLPIAIITLFELLASYCGGLGLVPAQDLSVWGPLV